MLEEKKYFRKVEQVFSITHTFGSTFAFSPTAQIQAKKMQKSYQANARQKRQEEANDIKTAYNSRLALLPLFYCVSALFYAFKSYISKTI